MCLCFLDISLHEIHSSVMAGNSDWTLRLCSVAFPIIPIFCRSIDFQNMILQFALIDWSFAVEKWHSKEIFVDIHQFNLICTQSMSNTDTDSIQFTLFKKEISLKLFSALFWYQHKMRCKSHGFFVFFCKKKKIWQNC